MYYVYIYNEKFKQIRKLVNVLEFIQIFKLHIYSFSLFLPENYIIYNICNNYNKYNLHTGLRHLEIFEST